MLTLAEKSGFEYFLRLQFCVFQASKEEGATVSDERLPLEINFELEVERSDLQKPLGGVRWRCCTETLLFR